MKAFLALAFVACATTAAAQEPLPHADPFAHPTFLAGSELHRIFEPNKLLDQLTIWSNVADGLSTLHARVAFGDHFREANGVMDNPWRFVAIKVGVSAAANLAAHKMRRSGHNRLANTTQIAGIVLSGSFAALNEHTIHGAQ